MTASLQHPVLLTDLTADQQLLPTAEIHSLLTEHAAESTESQLVADALNIAASLGLFTERPHPVVLSATGDARLDGRIAATIGVAQVVFAPETIGPQVLARRIGSALSEGAVVAAIITPNDNPEVIAVGDRAGIPVVHDLDAAAAPIAQAGERVEELGRRMGLELFEYELIERARISGARIVLPEGDDDRILKAADAILTDKVCDITILGNPTDIALRAADLGLNLSGVHIADPNGTDPSSLNARERFAQKLYELRKDKGMTLEQAKETVTDVSYYGTMMIYEGLADGMVSGAAHTTAHTIRPALQIIRTAPGSSVVSSIFLMVLPGTLWAFGDCAVNPNPTAEQLGEIALASAATARGFGIDPKVAMLSYSTGSSGAGPDVEKVIAAVEHARTLAEELGVDVAVDGPIQFDAAVVPSVGEKKMPGSDVAGHANVFVFPDLDSGNIAYKAVQRSANALAVGPVLQGLNKPVNDLSRGATVPDIINTIAVTAVQVGAMKCAEEEAQQAGEGSAAADGTAAETSASTGTADVADNN